MTWQTKESDCKAAWLITCEEPRCHWKATRAFVTAHLENKTIRCVKLCDHHASLLRGKMAADGHQLITDPDGVVGEPIASSASSPAAPAVDDRRAPQRVGKILVFPIPDGAEVTTCRSCSESVIWILTKNDKRMPVDAFGDTRGQSHFSTCKQADHWRKKKVKA